MIVLVKLVLSHLIGDFLLQTNQFIIGKESKKLRSWQLYVHSLLHGLLAWIALGGLKYWWLALLLAIIHGVIDFIKLEYQKLENRARWMIIDQILHLISILFIWIIYDHFESIITINLFSDKNILYYTIIYFLTQPTAIILAQLMQKWSNEIPDRTDGSLVNAGKYIGILERLYVFGFTISGNIQAIGLLIAAKSVFRFGDLKESKSRKLTEYILIGTLLSFGLAICSALIILNLEEIICSD